MPLPAGCTAKYLAVITNFGKFILTDRGFNFYDAFLVKFKTMNKDKVSRKCDFRIIESFLPLQLETDSSTGLPKSSNGQKASNKSP